MTAPIDADWESSLTANRCEYAYGLAGIAQRKQFQVFADTGMRAARERDPRMLKALEKMTEFTLKAQENQVGQTIRSTHATFGESRGTTEHQLVREAYKALDQGQPIPHLEWIYGSAAWLCGYARHP